MSMINQRREPQPIILPPSRYEAVTQATPVVRPLPLLPSSAYCGCCRSIVESGTRYCGNCGVRLRNTWYVRA